MAAEVLAPSAATAVEVATPNEPSATIPSTATITSPSVSPSAVARSKTHATNNNNDSYSKKYRALVIDSGPIIKLTGVSALRDRAEQFYTVPAVLEEIRDAKARAHLEQLPFNIQTKQPSSESIHAVTEFSRLTGDYASLSSVDLQVMALLYELEREGCQGNMEHVRTTPKRTVGGGKVEFLGQAKDQQKQQQDEKEAQGQEESPPGEESTVENAMTQATSFFEGQPTVVEEEESSDDVNQRNLQSEVLAPNNNNNKPKTWAMLVNPKAASTAPAKPPATEEPMTVQQNVGVTEPNPNNPTATVAGQFCDADEDESSFDSNEEISDEDCDIYILDPDETKPTEQDLDQELQSDFPSLAASLQVPCEGEEKDSHHADEYGFTEEQIKQMAVQPISKSGKLYPTFRGKYKKLFQPAPTTTKSEEKARMERASALNVVQEEEGEHVSNPSQSRIMGGMTMSGQEIDVEDDGEGWITCARDIRSVQATGSLAPSPHALDGLSAQNGPPICQRAACATTDFAMQNCILQMNLELLSVDGVKIRRLKNWIMRCGACFQVYTKHDDTGPHGMKRLFCERCGSDMLQRIAASVDSKTGRLRLHMSKKHKNNLRGTKFSLPKPGTGDRFQGDILLREDQLMMGAWNQKVKIRSGGKAKGPASSMFGADIATNVGCRAQSMRSDDINVGFGRRNPNAAKGRERRGKKKKSAGKACGLRRYA